MKSRKRLAKSGLEGSDMESSTLLSEREPLDNRLMTILEQRGYHSSEIPELVRRCEEPPPCSWFRRLLRFLRVWV
jgi:hypothetical protein